MTFEAPGSFATPAPAPAPEPEAPVAPAPEKTEPEFRVGSIVKTIDGRLAVIVGTGAASRLGESGELEDQPGYRIAYFASVIDSPHTAEELGLAAP